MMFVVFMIFGLEKKTFPAGRPLDKNRNVIYTNNNTCTASRKEEKCANKNYPIVVVVSLSLSYSLVQRENKK